MSANAYFIEDHVTLPPSVVQVESRLPLVRRALLVRAKPHRIPNRPSALRHMQTVGTLITWFLVRCRGIQIVMLECVVAAAHVVTQETTSYRTGVPVIGRIKNAFRISLFPSENHWDIVVKAEGEISRSICVLAKTADVVAILPRMRRVR
jgi:hypothetical protein